MRIDAHHHFWHYDPITCGWMDETMDVLKQDYLPDQFEDVLKENQINGCIAVQADQSEKESHFLIQLAHAHDFIKGVVGWVDLQDPSVKDRLAHFAAMPAFKGVRHIVQAEPEGFMLQKAFMNGVNQLNQFDLTYDILIYPHQLEEAIQFCKKFPNQKFVLDHMAKPYIKKGILSPWAEQIHLLGELENVWCKLSGMMTEAAPEHKAIEDYSPYLDTVFEAFGTDRLLFGSDWPVCLLADSYQKNLALIETYISRCSSYEQAKIMGLNAIDFYNITT